MQTNIEDTIPDSSTHSLPPSVEESINENVSSNGDRVEDSDELAENAYIATPSVATFADTALTETIDNKEDLKVKVHFIPVGNAPIMKRTKFLVAKVETFASLQNRLRKLIMQPILIQNHTTPPLFMYLHTCFVPSLEDTVGNLFELYHTNQELKVHYSLQEAWG